MLEKLSNLTCLKPHALVLHRFVKYLFLKIRLSLQVLLGLLSQYLLSNPQSPIEKKKGKSGKREKEEKKKGKQDLYASALGLRPSDGTVRKI